MRPGSAPVAGVGTPGPVLAPCTFVLGAAVGDVQPLVNAQVGSATLVGVGPGVRAGGGVETGAAAIVTAAAGTASAAMLNLCQFTAYPPDAAFVP